VNGHEFAKKYTPEQKEHAISCYLATGSYTKAAALCDMPWQTIALWKHRDPRGWEEIVGKLNAEMEEQYRAGWRNVLVRSLDVMQDRLENGNHVLTKDGIVRVPVPAKDAVVIGGIAADKLRVSMGLPNRITGKVEDNDRLDELRKLAEASRKARAEKDQPEGQTLN
jgi:hypothetical protein